MYLAVIGTEKLENGLQIVGAHIDSPRLDLKPNPLYEDTGFAYFKTHYYGGIKKYQWTTIPLAIHGVIAKTNGEKIEITVGENEDEPIFTITDLLPHLAQEQMQKKLEKVSKGAGVYSGLYILSQTDETTLRKILITDEFVRFVRTLQHYKSGGYYTFSSKELEQYINYQLSQYENQSNLFSAE